MIVVAAVAGQFGKQIARNAFGGGNNQNTGSSLESIQLEVARTLNQDLPKRLDDNTVFQSAEANGKVLTYRYSFTFPLDEYDMGVFTKNRGLLLAQVCSNDNMYFSMGYGAAYNYYYTDVNGVLVGEVYISKGECDAGSYR